MISTNSKWVQSSIAQMSEFWEKLNVIALHVRFSPSSFTVQRTTVFAAIFDSVRSLVT